jgi:hypothetical protein
LYVSVEIENFRDCLIVSIDELTAHGLLGRTRKEYTLLIDPLREYYNGLF